MRHCIFSANWCEKPFLALYGVCCLAGLGREAKLCWVTWVCSILARCVPQMYVEGGSSLGRARLR
jgi:hypothetical protein